MSNVFSNVLFSSRNLLFGLCFALFASFVLPLQAAETKSGKPGLLILSHGSPSPRWNEPVNELAKKVEELNKKEGTFHAVTGAFMEFAQPDTAAGVKVLEDAGCDRIIVVPIFVCPTSHTHFDVPAALGIYSSPSTREGMKEENITPASPKVPVTVTQTMSEGDLLDRFVRDEIAALSTNGKEETVVLIAHGDSSHAGLVDNIMKRLLKEAIDSKEISDGKYVYCGVGQTYRKNVVPVVEEMAKDKKRVLMVGFYLSSSAKSIHDSGMRMGRGRDAEQLPNPYEGIEIKFSEKGIVTHPQTPNWILETATQAL